jgi:mRNA-degrading endonuclease YafQ of YafQ-DinJ toxin-antitoxin module
MNIKQTRNFEKLYKKLHKNQQAAVNKAISSIVNNPKIGEQKKGDLAGVYVHKFSMVGQLTLLAYNFFEDELIILLLHIGSHENFYRDMKRN